MNRATLASAAVLVLSVLPACSASQGPDSTSVATTTAAETVAPSAGATSALEILRQGGTFMFSLDESDAAAFWRERCGSESAGDAAKADACYAKVREAGSGEGMRFALDAEKRVVWTSFGHEDGKEVVFVEAPLNVSADGEHAVLSSFAAAPKGPQLKDEKDWASAKIRIELPDATTMVMKDPRKGKLVFHRVGQ